MPGSVIKLPGEPDPLNPDTGYQFVIEPGETGWYHTDGLPYWVASYQSAKLMADAFDLMREPLPKNLKYHFATEWPGYYVPLRQPDAVVHPWTDHPLLLARRDIHLKTLTESEKLIDVTFQETNNPNQHGVVNFILETGFGSPHASLPLYSFFDNNFSAYDIHFSYYKDFLDDMLGRDAAQQATYLRGYSATTNHELGYAFGLEHTFFNLKLPGIEDNQDFTLMSYSADSFEPYGDVPFVSFRDMDIAALQFMYGPSKKGPHG